MSGRRLTAVFIAIVVAGLPPGAARAQDDTPLPNLVPQQFWNKSSDAADAGDPDALAFRFGISFLNVGRYPLDIAGRRESIGALRFSGAQCVEWTPKRLCTARVPAGRFVWLKNLRVFVFEDFARYELRRLTGDGRPVMTPDGLIARRPRTACLADAQQANQSSIPPAVDEWTIYTVQTYRQCALPREGISAGWMISFANESDGQSLPLAGVDDGDYALVATVNPDHVLRESSYDDNMAFTTIRIHRESYGTVTTQIGPP